MTEASPDSISVDLHPSAGSKKDQQRYSATLGAMLVSRRAGWTLPALALLVAAASLMISSRSYFVADDFLYGDILRTTPLSMDLLGRSWFGHLVPGFILLDWTFYRTFGLNWALASAMMAAVCAGATVAFVRCLDPVIGRKNIATVGGALFGLSLAVLFQSVWWGAVVTNLIPLAAGISTIGCLTRWARTGQLRYLLTMGLMYSVAVAFYEKSLLYAAYAGLWTILVIDAGQPLRERVRLLVHRWPAWLVLGCISLTVLWVYTRGEYVQEWGDPATTAQTAQFVLRGAALGLVPSIFGADLEQFSSIFGAEIVGVSIDKLGLAFAAIANLVLLAVVVMTVRADRRAWGPWIFAVLAILINQVPLAKARFQFFGVDGGRLLRYQMDNAFVLLAVLVVVLTWYLTGKQEAPAISRAAPRRGILIACSAFGAVICLTLWVASGAKTVERAKGVASKTWNDNLTASLPPASGHLLDGPLPENIAFAAMYPYNLISRVVPQVHPDVAIGADMHGGWAIGPDGSAGPAQFVASKESDLTECSEPDGTITPVVLDAGFAAPSYVLIELNSEGSGTVRVTSGPPGSMASVTRMDSPLPVVPGDNSLVVMAPSGTDLTMISAGSAETAFCVSRIAVGQITP